MKKVKVYCQAFLLCKNEATTTEPHPILEDYPICKRCKDKLAAIEAMTRSGLKKAKKGLTSRTE